MKPTKQELELFSKENSWEVKMDASKGLDNWSNYSGPSLGNLVVIPGIGRNRDSEVLDKSNFEAALEMLGGESETVEIHRFGHWGCGWFELLTVDSKDRKALTKAFEISKSLDGYPVLDEDDFSDRENEYQMEYAEQAKDDLAEAIRIHFGLPEEFKDSEDLINLAFELNLECQRYAGNDSCIDVYRTREPEEYALKRLEDVLNQMKYSSLNNSAYDYLCACMDIDRGAK